ncbi:Hypothetical protein CINCED_3A008574 [Cinara cedri]|uniref:Secreted protein n=1 Tax=Cinara cedri TaxID=506608 RepID=A0A5E4NL86_9HEMI|nr:Hypothetical protein CINCED_3A008574 [Cinara cedri]
MNSFSTVTTLVVLMIFSANTSAQQQEDPKICRIKYRLHENLATILQNPWGLQILNDSRQNMMNICMDSQAHNAIIGLLDGITDVTTNPNVSRTIGNMFFWTRKVMKDKNFQNVWLQTMIGVNNLFKRQKPAKKVVIALLNSLDRFLVTDQFDEKFEKVVEKLTQIVSLQINEESSDDI